MGSMKMEKHRASLTPEQLSASSALRAQAQAQAAMMQGAGQMNSLIDYGAYLQQAAPFRRPKNAYTSETIERLTDALTKATDRLADMAGIEESAA